MERIMTGSGKDRRLQHRSVEFCRDRDNNSRGGFTLIELLVAMAILMLIVLMMATLFHQSSVAWNNGLRQAEMSIQARSAMSIMRRDISQAVASEEYKCNFSGSSIDIYVLGTTTGDVRTIRRIKYSRSGSAITRSSAEFRPGSGGNYFGTAFNQKSGSLVDNVEDFQVTPGPGGSATNLPAWVDIELTLEKTTMGAAGIRVWSNGRDHTFDTDDDKRKRLRTWQ